jgi:hypothetical protein
MYTLSCVTPEMHLLKQIQLSLLTLNPTWAHFVMVSQKVITYCCKNINLQVHPVIQYIHHMLIAQLP